MKDPHLQRNSHWTDESHPKGMCGPPEYPSPDLSSTNGVHTYLGADTALLHSHQWWGHQEKRFIIILTALKKAWSAG